MNLMNFPVDTGTTLMFKEALYHAECQQCGDKLDLEALFDADGTDYVARCCGMTYWMKPETVRFEVELDEEV